jgi:hypothetical protein
MKKSTVLLCLCTLILVASLTRCVLEPRHVVETCGTVEQCQEWERLNAMPEFKNARSPATMQP